MTPRERASALLDLDDGRGALKRAAADLDADPELRGAVVTLAAERRVELPSGAETWPGKRLLRAARDRSGAAQEIRSPIARDEGFTCSTCRRTTPPHGRTARDHCPFCLWSEHVDVIPGDRAAGCGGRLEPVAVEKRGGGRFVTIVRGLPAADNDLASLLAKLKADLGTGGTVKDDTVEIQGKQIEGVRTTLAALGYKVKG